VVSRQQPGKRLFYAWYARMNAGCLERQSFLLPDWIMLNTRRGVEQTNVQAQ
jgi:hypothetical protein